MLQSSTARKLLFTLAALFLLLRFVNLTADYPRNIRWDDGIVTDEGWYASGAVNQHTWGRPLLAGDMNIPVIMPLWSAIGEAAFHVGGYGVTTLRVTAILFFFLCACLCCILLRRYGAAKWTPLFLAMIALNPWAFAFSRAAFLEFPMLSFVLLAAVCIPAKETGSTKASLARIFGAGLVFALALLLKTTAVALAPALVYGVLERNRFDWRKTLRETVVLFSGTAVIYGTYWTVVVRPRTSDVRFYLSVVKNTLRFTPFGFLADTSRPFRYGLGSDHLLFTLSLVALVCSIGFRRFRALWRDPLFAFAGVWVVSFLGFMVKHNNDPARYFAITIPACLLLTIALLRNRDWSTERVRHFLAFLLILDMGLNAGQVLASVTHPRFSFHNATVEIANIVRQESGPDPVIIGDEMHEVALHNGVRPVNLLFHSGTIAEQMTRYKPGWWLQFLPVDDGKCFREVLSHTYTAEFRQQWEIFYPGQKLVLWKLTPKPGAERLPAELSEAQTAACSPPVYN